MAKTLRSRIAAVAVAAVGISGLVAVAPAYAAVSATLDGPVRVSFTDGVRDSVPAQTFAFTPDAALAAGATNDVILEVTQAPTSAAEVTVVVGGKTAVDSLASAGTASTNSALGASLVSGTAVTGSSISISANAASGTYTGTITLREDAAATVVINWSFTTTGKVASLSTSVSAVELPAVAVSGGAFVVSKSVTLTLKDSAGNKTQPASGDTVDYSITGSGTNIAFAHTGTASGTISNASLADGSEAVTIGSVTADADSETATFAPKGVMPAQGVASVTVTAKTVGYGATTTPVTAVTAPTSASVIKAGATATAKTADSSVTKYTFNVSGWEVGKAYKIIATVTNGSGGGAPTATINDTTGDLTETFYGIATAAGFDVTITTASQAAADTVAIDGNGDGDVTDSSDMVVTLAAATYAVSVTTPVVTPSIQVTSAAIAVAGKVADQFGNPLQGATVTATGTQTLSSGTAANLVAQGTTGVDGTYSVTLPAANALTTSVSIVVSAVKTGAGAITDASAYVVNLNAAGSADSIAGSLIGDEDTATTVTTYPAVVVPYTGLAKGVSNELYTISSADNDGTLDNTDSCVEVTATTSPDGQIVATGSTGVLFYTAACNDSTVASGKSTVTVADTGAANLWVTSTKTGLNTFTITSGGVSKTFKFYAYNALTAASSGDAARNISVTTVSLKGGEVGRVTASVTDAFGNPVVVAATATFTATITGGAMLDGPAISKSYTATDASGNITIGVIAGAVAGSATITVTGANAQFGAAAGAATGTTAGTNGLTASVKSATSAVTVTADTTAATANAALQAQVAALSATITTIQTAISTLVASTTATLTLMSSQIRKIMKKLNIK